MESLQLRRSGGICTAALLLVCFDASAAVYKCVDAKGKQTYQQQPCPTTSAASKVKAGGDWTLIKNQIYFEAEPKQVGSYQRFTFRLKDKNFRGEPVNVDGYAYYDCALSLIGGPHLRTDLAGRNQPVDLAAIESKLQARSGATPFETYRHSGDSRLLPLADPEFVNFACGTSVTTSDGPRPSGPEAVIHAAKPEGMSISDISFGANDWVKIRGTAAGSGAVLKFMNNLERTSEFESPNTPYAGTAEDGSFEVNVRHVKGAGQ